MIGADVELSVAREFVKIVQRRLISSTHKVKAKAGNLHVDASQHFIRICHGRTRGILMGQSTLGSNYQTPKGGPTLIMMVGLQGAGKTTTTWKN